MQSRWSAAFLVLGVLPAVHGAQLQLLGEPHGLMPAQYEGATRDHGVADLDGDGDLDLLLARHGPDAVLLGDGSGRFEELPGAVPAGGAVTYAATLGDVDGDGDQDAVLLLAGPNALLLNQGTGSFETSALLPPDEETSRDGALSDVNLDGELDLVVANEGPNRLYLGEGQGAFAEVPDALPQLWTGSGKALAVLDADLDGDPDLLFAGRSGWSPLPTTDLLLHNQGGAVFTDASMLLPAHPAAVYALAVGDVDADGDQDVLLGTGEYTLEKALLYVGDGQGGFGLGAWPKAPSGSFGAVALGDLDGDGDLDAYFGRRFDVVSGGSTGGADEIQWNDAGIFTLAPGALPKLKEPTESVVLVDVDGDGDLDALLGDRDRLLLGDGSGSLLLDPEPLPDSPLAGMSIVVGAGDVDGDGDLDAVVSGRPEEVLTRAPLTYLFTNDGTGFFQDATGALPPVTACSCDYAAGAVLFLDVEGDGDLDLVVGSRTGMPPSFGGTLTLYGNLGGAFADWSPELSWWNRMVNDLDAGDVDGDGDADVVVSSSPREELLVNRGSGSFVLATGQLPRAHLPGTRYTSSLGDVDADGDLDLLLGNGSLTSQPGVIPKSLYLNDGSGSYADASWQLPRAEETFHSWAVALADLDTDGDLDAFAGNGGSGHDRLYANAGDGWYRDETSGKLPPSGSAASVAVGDFDGNGWPDLLVGGYLRLNSHGAFLAEDDLAPGSAYVDSVAPGDLDADGDLDALLGKSVADGRARLWRNLLRQTIRRGPARGGKPFALEVRGGPQADAMVAAAAGAGEWPLPPFGTLYLDPSSLHVVWQGSLDGAGRSILTFAVPPDPAVIGATVHFQTLLGQPPHFSNREAVTIKDW